MKPVLNFFLVVFFSLSAQASIEMALTIDDIPAHETEAPGLSRLEIHKKILATLKKHNLKGVYGFLNGGKISTTPDGEKIVQEWVKAGQNLGNHTLTHQWLAKVSADTFIHEISSNEEFLKNYSTKPNWKWFRYPFLAEGDSLEKRNAIRDYLLKNNYKTAQVTVDSNDWAWNDPYSRCLGTKDQKSIQWLKSTFLKNAEAELTQVEEWSKKLFNRSIKHVLLIHVGSLTSEVLDDLLSLYKRKGVKFISLEQASKDPLYSEDPQITMTYGLPLVSQWAQKKGMWIPYNPARPDIKILNSTCVSKP